MIWGTDETEVGQGQWRLTKLERAHREILSECSSSEQSPVTDHCSADVHSAVSPIARKEGM